MLDPTNLKQMRHATGLWCKRTDRATRKIASNNLLVRVTRRRRDVSGDCDITLVRYDLPNISRGRAYGENPKQTRTRFVPEIGKWVIPIDLNFDVDVPPPGLLWAAHISLRGFNAFTRFTNNAKDFVYKWTDGVYFDSEEEDKDTLDVLVDTMFSMVPESFKDRYATNPLVTTKILNNPDADSMPAIILSPGMGVQAMRRFIAEHLQMSSANNTNRPVLAPGNCNLITIER